MDVSNARTLWLRRATVGRFTRLACRLFAPVALGLIAETSTGCTIAGYAIGTAQIPEPRSYPVESASVLRRGEDVEVYYLPGPTEPTPVVATARQGPRPVFPGTEFSVATGAYKGVEADQLVLGNPVWVDGTASHEAYTPSKPGRFVTKRSAVPLRQVSLIRTKPPHTNALLGTIAGFAADVVFVTLYARVMSNVH